MRKTLITIGEANRTVLETAIVLIECVDYTYMRWVR